MINCGSYFSYLSNVSLQIYIYIYYCCNEIGIVKDIYILYIYIFDVKDNKSESIPSGFFVGLDHPLKNLG